jgi:N-acetylmuramoyl-L-alanine amidase
VAKTDWVLSPNHNDRTSRIQLIVLHCDASPNEQATLSWLANPASKVSYHALIHRDGWVSRIVPDDRRAWHAGKSKWQDITDVNGASLGLAFANKHDGREPLTNAQLDIAQAVVQYWRQQYDITAVVGHRDVAPQRKTDPYLAPNFRLEDYA